MVTDTSVALKTLKEMMSEANGAADRVYRSLLMAVNLISAKLIKADTDNCDRAIDDSLRILGQVAGVDRAYIWENYEKEGVLYCRQICEWSEGADPQQGKEFTAGMAYDSVPLWRAAMLDNKPMNVIVRDMPDGYEKDFIASQGIKSLLLFPIVHHGQPWGFVGFDNCRTERVFPKEHETVLQSGGTLIVSNLLRYRMIHDLLVAKEEAQASARAKSEFLARMSHELRTPLNAIVGMTKLALSCDDLDEVRKYLNTVDASSEQLLDIVNSVLDMSKITSKKMGLAYEEFDFEKMLKRVANAAQAKFTEKNINFAVYCPQPFFRTVVGDDRRLSQILANLLDNASKFTPPGGEVDLKVDRTPIDDNRALLHIEVTDNGCGVSRDVRDRIFQPFEQGDGGIDRQHGGTGLGLAICKHLCELMGGKIWFESEPGRGASFFLEMCVEWGRQLKIRPDTTVESLDPAAILAAAQAQNGSDADSYDFRGNVVLLAEDIDTNRKLIELFLEDTGVTIDHAEDGEEAVSKYKAAPKKYSAILMDIQMPKLDGISAAKMIRASGLQNAKKIPIIAMTTGAFKADAEMSRDAGMNAYLTKPIDVKELLETLAKVM